VRAIGEVGELDALTFELTHPPHVIARIKHMRKRHLEHLLDLGRIETQRQIGLQDSDHRRHAITRDHHMVRQKPEYLDMHAREADFFLGFAQRGFYRTLVLRLDTAARKTDLPGVVLEVGCPLREQDGRTVPTLDKRHEYRGWNRLVGEKPPQARATLRRDVPMPPIIDRGVTRLAQ